MNYNSFIIFFILIINISQINQFQHIYYTNQNRIQYSKKTKHYHQILAYIHYISNKFFQVQTSKFYKILNYLYEVQIFKIYYYNYLFPYIHRTYYNHKGNNNIFLHFFHNFYYICCISNQNQLNNILNYVHVL